VTLPEKRVKDRRIQKTQRLLHEALFSLIHEKNYDAIVVKEILDRANVGRSTFYTHFRDKDELLVCGMHDMLSSVQSAGRPSSATRYEEIIWFSLLIFEHISHHRLAGEARIGTRGRAIIHEHLQKVLTELIADGVNKHFAGMNRGNCMRICDSCESGDAFRGERGKLCWIVAEKFSGVCGTAMEVKFSFWIRGDTRVDFGDFFAHILRVDTNGRNLRIGHKSSLAPIGRDGVRGRARPSRSEPSAHARLSPQRKAW
jgi:hypothetical protein